MHEHIKSLTTKGVHSDITKTWHILNQNEKNNDKDPKTPAHYPVYISRDLHFFRVS